MGRIITFRGRQVHVGGHRPTVHDANRLHMSETPAAQAFAGLTLPNSTNWRAGLPTPIGDGGNSQVGDCPFAAARVLLMLRAGSLGRALNISTADTLAAYAAATGWNGIVGDPSDQGDTVDGMVDYMRRTGIDGLEFGDAVTIRSGNILHIRQAIAFLVGGVNFGLSLPDAWLKDDSLTVWDVSGPPNPNNGHDVMGLDLLADGNVLIDSWGELLELTPGAIKTYADDVRAIQTPNAFGPSGLNAAGLTAQEASLDLPALA